MKPEELAIEIAEAMGWRISPIESPTKEEFYLESPDTEPNCGMRVCWGTVLKLIPRPDTDPADFLAMLEWALRNDIYIEMFFGGVEFLAICVGQEYRMSFHGDTLQIATCRAVVAALREKGGRE